MIPRFYVYLHAKISKLSTESFIDYFSTQRQQRIIFVLKELHLYEYNESLIIQIVKLGFYNCNFVFYLKKCHLLKRSSWSTRLMTQITNQESLAALPKKTLSSAIAHNKTEPEDRSHTLKNPHPGKMFSKIWLTLSYLWASLQPKWNNW